MVYIESNNKKVLIDPWIKGNPKALINIKEAVELKPDYILITHDHHDHGFEEAIEICKKTNAKLVGVIELIEKAKDEGIINIIPLNIGGYYKDETLKIHMFQAAHTTSPHTGVATTFVVSDNKNAIFHGGDTGVMVDFEIISKLYDLSIAILPIGGRFTMSYEDMNVVKDYLKAKRYIGIHYDTFEAIKINKDEARKYIELYEDIPNYTIEL